MPLNEADGYGDTQIADPLLTRYVEVYRGGNALRFGGGNDLAKLAAVCCHCHAQKTQRRQSNQVVLYPIS